MIARALLLVLGLASSAAAQPALGDGGIEIDNGAGQVIENAARLLNMQSGDFACTSQATGEVLCELGSNASELGSCIGDVGTEFCNPTIMPYAIIGGSTATDGVSIKPSSAATQSGAVKFCADTPSATGQTCLRVYPDGVSLASNAALVVGFNDSPTATQTTDALAAGVLPSIYGGQISPSLTVSDSSIGGSSFGSAIGVSIGATLTNGTDDNYSGGIGIGVLGGLAVTKTSTGTATMATGDVFRSQITAPGASTTMTTVSDYRALDLNGTVSGTVTRHWGFLAESFTKGTAAFPFGAGRFSAFTGTPPSGYAAWGVETGVSTDADRFVFKNAAGQTTRLQQFCMTAVGTGLSNSATRYFTLGTSVAVNATETSVDSPTPGAMKWYSLACGVVTPVGTSSHSLTFTVRDDTADVSGSSCAISNSASCPTGCSCTARSETGVSIASGSQLAIQVVPANTPTVTDGVATCVACFVLDAF